MVEFNLMPQTSMSPLAGDIKRDPRDLVAEKFLTWVAWQTANKSFGVMYGLHFQQSMDQPGMSCPWSQYDTTPEAR